MSNPTVDQIDAGTSIHRQKAADFWKKFKSIKSSSSREKSGYTFGVRRKRLGMSLGRARNNASYTRRIILTSQSTEKIVLTVKDQKLLDFDLNLPKSFDENMVASYKAALLDRLRYEEMRDILEGTTGINKIFVEQFTSWESKKLDVAINLLTAKAHAGPLFD